MSINLEYFLFDCHRLIFIKEFILLTKVRQKKNLLLQKTLFKFFLVLNLNNEDIVFYLYI